MEMTPERCACTDPTPVFGNVTHVWYCFDCGGDIETGRMVTYEQFLAGARAAISGVTA